MNLGMQKLGFGNLVKVEDGRWVNSNSVRQIEERDSGNDKSTFIWFKPTGGEAYEKNVVLKGAQGEELAKKFNAKI